MSYRVSGRLEDAKQVFLRAITISPNYSYFYSNLSTVYRLQKKEKESFELLLKAISLGGQLQEYLSVIDFYKNVGNLKKALILSIAVVKQFPHEYEAHFKLGNMFMLIKDHSKAVIAYSEALKLTSKNAKLYNNIAVAYKELGQNDKSLNSYKQALALVPNDPMTHNNLGNLLRTMGDIDGAKKHLQIAIAIAPKYADAYSNMGVLYKELRDYASAISYYKKAIEINPKHINANFDVSLIQLAEGDYKEGWEKYEYRLKMTELIAKTHKYKTPLWQGEPLEGKTIILQNEQGYGDNIMFARYVKNFKDFGATVLMRTREPLVELFHSIGGVDGVYSENGDIPPHDFYLPLLSAAKMFDTTLDNIPCNFPYLYAKKPFCLNLDSTILNVGLVWSSSRTNKDFKNKYLGLEPLKRLFELENTLFYSLQVGNDADEIKKYGLENKIIDLSKELDNFAKTASAIEALDIVITMDTAVAHLCGAMNKKAFVLLPRPADWRWMQEGDSTPWYPSLRLFRQSQKGEWGTPVLELRQELQKLIKK